MLGTVVLSCPIQTPCLPKETAAGSPPTESADRAGKTTLYTRMDRSRGRRAASALPAIPLDP